MSEDDARILHNRRVIADRLGWPEGALDACLALEEQYPRWGVFWTDGGPLRDSRPGYRAYAIASGRSHGMSAETPDQLRWLLVG